MKTDPIVAEVREQRQAILQSYQGDFAQMNADVMKRQWSSGHRVVSRGPKAVRLGQAPNAYPICDRTLRVGEGDST